MHNTNGEVILLVKLQDTACNFTKSHTFPWVFFTFFKFYKWYQIAQSVSNYIDSRQNTYQRLVSCIFLWNSKKPSTKCLKVSEYLPNVLCIYTRVVKLLHVQTVNHLKPFLFQLILIRGRR